jgi:hypothetical protein
MAVFRAATKSFLAPPNTRKSAVSVPPSGNGRLSVTPSPTRPPPQAAVCQRADSSNRHSLVAHSDLHAVPSGFLPRGLSDACPPLSGMRPPSHFRAGIRQPLTEADGEVIKDLIVWATALLPKPDGAVTSAMRRAPEPRSTDAEQGEFDPQAQPALDYAGVRIRSAHRLVVQGRCQNKMRHDEPQRSSGMTRAYSPESRRQRLLSGLQAALRVRYGSFMAAPRTS